MVLLSQVNKSSIHQICLDLSTVKQFITLDKLVYIILKVFTSRISCWEKYSSEILNIQTRVLGQTNLSMNRVSGPNKNLPEDRLLFQGINSGVGEGEETNKIQILIILANIFSQHIHSREGQVLKIQNKLKQDFKSIKK